MRSHFRPPLTIVVPLIIVAVAVMQTAIGAVGRDTSSEYPRAVVLDVGQGDAILLDGPGDDAEVLVDGGPDGTVLLRALRKQLGRDRTLNLVVLTHPHEDHVAGLVDVLERYDVKRVLITGVAHTTRSYRSFLERIADQQIPTDVAIAGLHEDVAPFDIEVLAPLEDLQGTTLAELNLTSIILMVSMGDRRMLLTGDAETPVEESLLERGVSLAADVLKVGHHGSQTASSAAFLESVHPTDAIISVGARNQFGHPHRRTLKRLERIGAVVWNTSVNGDVVVEFREDGMIDVVAASE
ncbi:MAG: MBL fold metallo-hydrolase [Candidatus Uhrbacteria bacterium]